MNLGTKDGRGAVILAEVRERELSDKTSQSAFGGTVRDRSGGSSEDPDQSLPLRFEARNTDRA